jgi:hypothetical protein
MQAEKIASFATIKEAVRHDYLEFYRKRQNAEALEKLKKKFTITVG